MTDEISALVPTVMEDGADFTVVATSPKEMERAQQSLILWAARKIQAEKELMSEAAQQYDTALENNWGSGGWARRISLSEDKIEYYRKIKEALEAGYYIVPPFPMNVFAIRTEKKRPSERMGWASKADAELRGIHPKAVKAGLGEYVSNKVWTTTFTKYVKGVLDKLEERTYHQPDRFRRVEFPFKLAKSAVMSETAKAMALKIFDQIGIMGNTPVANAAVPDPIVCGQIMPWFHKKQPVTFFIAWWLDTSSL
jgi:hypothetical protein